MNMNNILYNDLPLIVYFSLFFMFIRRHPYYFVLFFYLFMQQVKNILSNYYVNINAPIFMREVEKYSVNDGSLLLLVILYIVAFLSIYLVYKYMFKYRIKNLQISFLQSKNTKLFVYLFVYLTLIIVIILIIHILSYNTPLFNPHINKNNYWTDYALIPQIKFLSSQLNLLLFIIGFFYAKQTLFLQNKYVSKFIYYLILILSILYYVLMKQKFGGPLLMLFSFFLPYLLLGLIYKKIDLKKLLTYMFIMIIVLSITVYGYFYMRFGTDAGKMILERIFSLQSEIWETTYIYLSNNILPFNKNEFIRELSVLLGFSNGFTGMQYVMSKVMEPDYFHFFINIHINLSSAYPSYLFYLFEDPMLELPLIILINFILYSIYIFLGFKVLENLLQNKILVSGLYLKLFFSFIAIIGQVYLDSIFTFKEILFIILILLLESDFFKMKNKKKGEYENIIYKRNK